MTLADFLSTWRGLTLENRLHRLAVLGLIGTNLVTAVALLRADHTVVLVPPVLEGQVSVARDSASREVKEAWALFVAELLGNVSPSSAEFIQKAVDPLLAPALRRPVLEVMAEQVCEIQHERVSMSFNVRAIAYDPPTDKVFVTGVQTTSGPGGKPVARTRTYELIVGFAHYRPLIRHLDVYPEEPRVGDRARAPSGPSPRTPPQENAMTRTLICALGFGTLVGAAPLQAAEDPGIPLPPVPRAVLLAANDQSATIRHVSAEVSENDASDMGETPAATLALGPKTIRVSPGTTTIVEVAIDHLNRIVTPFTSPQVRTVSRATTQVDGNAIYVATASEEPVSFFITEAGDTATAISLTLAPRHIPPREVRLVLTGALVRTAAPKVRPPRLLVRNDQPYVEHIVSVFRALAQNRVLPGYELRKVGRGERLNCRQPRLSVTTAQVLEGGGLRILAAKARNRGKQPIVLEEHRCSAGSGTLVAAVAAWPRSRLAPGEETELYVAVRPPESDSERGGRPSLLGRQR